MALTKLVFRPGINRETTAYANEGGWWDGNLVRFRAGKPESIGGWTKYSLEQSLGTGRSLMTWTALDGTVYTGMGTNLKYYVIRGGGLNDITPIRETTPAGAVTTLAGTAAASFEGSNGSRYYLAQVALDAVLWSMRAVVGNACGHQWCESRIQQQQPLAVQQGPRRRQF